MTRTCPPRSRVVYLPWSAWMIKSPTSSSWPCPRSYRTQIAIRTRKLSNLSRLGCLLRRRVQICPINTHWPRSLPSWTRITTLSQVTVKRCVEKRCHRTRGITRGTWPSHHQPVYKLVAARITTASFSLLIRNGGARLWLVSQWANSRPRMASQLHRLIIGNETKNSC